MIQAADGEARTQVGVTSARKGAISQHRPHSLMTHHLWKALANHKSHASWPFLTKMFMHSYDLIEATLKKQEENHEEKGVGNTTI